MKRLQLTFSKCVAFAPFFLLLLVIVMLMGFSFAGVGAYASWPSLLLWLLLVIASVVLFFKIKLYKKFSIFLLHVSFLFILAGALLTHLGGYGGILHLRVGECSSTFSGDGCTFSSPFSVRLDSFSVVKYEGTQTPADFQSFISIDEKENVVVSMNNIFERDGFRIYQTSYDEDENGTVLTIKYDKWGVRITYWGYFLLFVGMVGVLFSKSYMFRRLLRDKSWQCVLLLLVALNVDDVHAECRTMSEVEAETFGSLLVLYQGRITTVEAMATDFTKKLTGKTSYSGYSATQVMAGWLFSREDWQYEPMIRLKKNEQKLIGVSQSKVRFVDFFSEDGQYKLRQVYLRQADESGAESALEKILKLDAKAQAIMQLQSGELLKIFPSAGGQGATLLSPSECEDTMRIRHFLSLLYDSYSKKEDCVPWLNKFAQYQRKTLGEVVPPDYVLESESLYLRFNMIPLVSYAMLTLGLIYFVFVVGIGRRWTKELRVCAFAFSAIILLYLTFMIVLRSLASGHLPFANSYETLLVIAWLALLMAVGLSRKVALLLPLGILASGFALLSATIADNDPQLTPLMPVLRSPLLSIHVFLMMISYTLLLIITLSSVASLLRWTDREVCRKLNMVMLYPALFALTAGIFLGAVWANVSWGSYWSWDPKETWALITLLVYSFSFHSSFLGFLRRPLFFHLYLLVAFLFLLLTYFGVNILFGGMHSYGG